MRFNGAGLNSGAWEGTGPSGTAASRAPDAAAWYIPNQAGELFLVHGV